VKQSVNIPVVANGDIDSPEKAKYVLELTGADAVMIGRAAQGRPWIFREIGWFLKTGTHLAPPTVDEVASIVQEHLENLYGFYGEQKGYRIARKHIGWLVAKDGMHAPHGEAFRQQMNQIENTAAQLFAVTKYLETLKCQGHVFFDFGVSTSPATVDQLQSAA
jgi:tRNA-dihydrouridine synthase B